MRRRVGSQSARGSSDGSSAGSQNRRNSSPIGVPAPVRQSRSLSSLLSIYLGILLLRLLARGVLRTPNASRCSRFASSMGLSENNLRRTWTDAALMRSTVVHLLEFVYPAGDIDRMPHT